MAIGIQPESGRTVRHWPWEITAEDNAPSAIGTTSPPSRLAAGSYHTVAVTASGGVLAAGDNSHGQCDVGDWQDIVAVAAGSTHTLGLRADGTVASAGNNANCQCDVGSWSGIRVQGVRA